MHRNGWLVMSRVLCLVAAGLLLAGPGCTTKAKPRAVRAELPPVDAPAVLRGTVGTRVIMMGTEPTLLSGIGFVVGLKGTGGLVLDERVASTLQREMGLRGIGSPGRYDGTPLEGVTPRQLLADPNTAAVIVQAAVPPGSPPGTRFDVVVRALNATSLEGGRLWTTDLRVGDPSVVGGATTQRLAEATGEIFVNPFAEPGSETDGVTKNVGRVLSGGVVTDGFEIELRMRTPSHTLAQIIETAINSRFPMREGDRNPPARGRNDQSIALTVPFRYRDRAGEFIELVRHIQMDQTYPHVYAQRYVEAVQREPYLATEISWALQALGDKALPFIRELYEYPEIAPRLAGLRAGARLGDPRAATALQELAESGPADVRPNAIALLAELDAGPTIDLALRELLHEDDLTVRVAAYEGLADRAERRRRRQLLLLEQSQDLAPSQRLTLEQLKALPELRLDPRDVPIQGIGREAIAGKFLLDRVPYGEPLVYVAQQGMPRIVLFGDTLTVEKPMLLSAWSNRLLMVADSETEPVRLRYQTVPVANPRRPTPPRSVAYEFTVSENITELIETLAHRPTPEDMRPGLDMTYSEVVGALYELNKQGVMNAAFATERDRLQAALLAASEAEPITMRPENAQDEREIVLFARDVLPDRRPDTDPDRPRSLLVPLNQPPAEGEQQN